MNNKYYDVELIKAIRSGDKKSVITYLMSKTSVDFDSDAIDTKNLSIKGEVFLNTMLEFDEFTLRVNNLIHRLGKTREYNWFALDIDEDIKNAMEELFQVGFNFRADNTYNYDTDLDTILQGRYFKYEGEWYVLLEVHRGGDARGNYADVVCFKIVDYDYYVLGMRIQGYTDIEVDFDGSYSIESECTYNEDTDMWYYEGEEVRLYTQANGF